MKNHMKKPMLAVVSAGMLTASLFGIGAGDADARGLQKTPLPEPTVEVVEEFSFNFERIPPVMVVVGGGSGPVAELPPGDCSGVGECNTFIAKCAAAGGHFHEEHHNPQGEPNLGNCQSTPQAD